MGTRFTSPGAAAGRALQEFLIQREQQRRQQMLDGIAIANNLEQRQRAEQDAQRQARMDAQAAEDRQRRIATEERTYTDAQTRQAVLDQRYETEQRQRLMDRADQDAFRYQNAELGRIDADAERQFRASEAAKQRANAREIVNAQMKGSGKTESAADHNPAAVTIDALDSLSEAINTAEGIAAKAAGSWKAAAASANYDDDVAEYNAMLAGAIPSVARKLGHTGVLTELDVASVRKMFPTPGDSKSLRDRKIARIRSIMNMPGKSGGSGNGSGSTRRIGRFEVID